MKLEDSALKRLRVNVAWHKVRALNSDAQGIHHDSAN